MSAPKIVQRPLQTFKEWFAERYPDRHHRPHVGKELWFTGGWDGADDDIELLGNALSEYLDEQFTKEVR